MSSKLLQSATLEVENVGGIDQTEVGIKPGITVLSGRNATNRTSLLQAFMAALGSERASLKADADTGRAALTLNDETYVRRLERSGNHIRMEGNPFLDDPTLADLFAFLLESNEARRAVTTEGDLRELVLRPVDTEAIEREIQQLSDEKDEVTTELERLEELKRDLPDLEQERNQLIERIEAKRTELDEVKSEIEETDDTNERSAEEDELEERLDELSKLRSSLEDVRFDIETERESLDALQSDRESLANEKDSLPAADPDAKAAIEDEIEQLQSRTKSLDRAVRQLQDIVQFNEEMLKGTHPEVREALANVDVSANNTEAVTDQLLENDDSVLCWTCGSEVASEQIETTVDQLRSLHTSKLSQQKDLEEQMRDLRAERRQLASTRERRHSIESQLDEISTEIVSREENLEKLESHQEELKSKIEETEADAEALEAKVASASDDDQSKLVELNKRANDLEFKLGRLERDRESIGEQIEEIESTLERESTLEDRREEIREELEGLRTRIERIERDAVDSFNEHMETVLDVLDYSNIERIWLERVERQVQQGRRKVDRAEFDLHVVRTSENGRTYEDTIDHLSESEREVTGLIFALAGYLVHEVYEDLPFVLLDSLESLDSDRIASLVEYFGEYCDYLVVALLPEDSQALADDHQFIESI
ncbi:archaea-specific SMC-related protein [Natronosalvus rutilus]|uniref:AAA family ATPase n=1 Tax=Natronosalvus rutilus TaxID=2953753 RepID=A0A9E7ND61_9EURY|nr:archaea-specific SMC-related protein [Natronosalvus rutilus]UTF55725.1 AAA family ATPase [Natronosalvus rutilus]